ncbi:DUF6640 family protein [Melittangium boletus]|uniref:DUF6640 family protein n=1 Tax=Melittangium boletus TaxID=83453 RepID=UPI003DA1ECF0
MRLPLGRVLLSVSALAAAVGAFVADWNETHIFNPRWPPHAKFHNAQTMLLGSALGLATLYFLWSRRWRGPRGLEVGTLLASIYWLTQAGALLFPGTALTDPEFADRVPRIGGVLPFNQLAIELVFLTLVAVGFFLERRALRREAASTPLS